MINHIRFFFLVYLTVLSFSVIANERVAVIVNSANLQNLTAVDVRNIYADKSITWANGKKIAVYNLPISAAAREIFSKKVLGMSALAAASAESNRSITNTVRNPQKQKRERLVTMIVSKNPNAVGYVSEAAIKDKSGLRVLFTVE